MTEQIILPSGIVVPSGSGSGHIRPVADVLEFGADPTGVNECSNAINEAIDSLPAIGGDVLFRSNGGDNATYNIASTLEIGDGSNDAVSAKQGIRLIGEGIAYRVWGSSRPQPINLLWSGGASPMIRINGPLAGWGIENLGLEGSTLASHCLQVISGQYGRVRNAIMRRAQQVLHLTTIVPGVIVGASAGCMHNDFDRVSIGLDSRANSYGIHLNAVGLGSGEGCYFNWFKGIYMSFQNQVANRVEAFRLNGCDNIRFDNIHLSAIPATGPNYLITFNYVTKNNWPSDCLFQSISFGTSVAGKFLQSGVPDGTSTKNRIVDIRGADGIPPNPALANLAWGFTASNP